MEDCFVGRFGGDEILRRNAKAQKMIGSLAKNASSHPVV